MTRSSRDTMTAKRKPRSPWPANPPLVGEPVVSRYWRANVPAPAGTPDIEIGRVMIAEPSHHFTGPTMAPLIRCKADGSLRPLAKKPAKRKARK